jgi:hypothetical protein
MPRHVSENPTAELVGHLGHRGLVLELEVGSTQRSGRMHQARLAREKSKEVWRLDLAVGTRSLNGVKLRRDRVRQRGS